MGLVEEMWEAQRGRGPATVLAIATASPANCVYQADYPDFYFRVTKSEHMTELKDKFKRLCEKSSIRKRYFHLTEEILMQNSTICSYDENSLNARQDILIPEVPKLGMEAATKAIQEWGQPISTITHLIFYTTSGVDMPGADFRLAKLLGLNPSVKRLMLYNQGCYAGGTVLRVAKDLAENNARARILVVCVETMVVSFRAPNVNHIDILVGQAIFGDGAAAVIIGAEPRLGIEFPLFQIVSASQTIIPESENAIHGHLREMGLTYYLSDKVPNFIANSIEKCLNEALKPIGVEDRNSLFYVVHPGGPAILDKVEEKLGLEEGKLRVTRYVLREYGNMWSPCVLFILDEMRKRSKIAGKTTTGEGLDWGVLVGFGPGLTVETVVLHSIPIVPTH